MESSLDGAMNPTEISLWLKERLAEYEKNNGIEVLGVVDKASSELIGYCGLFYFPDIDGAPEIEIGYRLVRKMWGSGLATEAAKAIRDHAFADLKLKRLIALIEPDNKRSIRVAEKLGMTHEKDVMLEGYDYPDLLFSVSS